MVVRTAWLASLVVAAAAQSCPSAIDGSITTLGGDGSLVLKDLGVEFAVTLDANKTEGFTVSVTGDAIGNKLAIEGTEVSGILKFKEATRRSPEADAPGRSKKCEPEFPCYGRATIVVSDPTGMCEDATWDFTPMVHMRHAPLVPLVVSATLGPITRDPIITLVVSGWLTRCMLVGDGWLASLRYLDTDLLETLRGSYSSIFLFAIMISGVTGGAIKSGGAKAIGQAIGRLVRNSFLAQVAVYAAGFVFFIDDYSNTVIVGSTLRVITDTMRLSREKLSFLVDCTASPIASVMPLSTWIGYEVSLIKDEIERIGYDREAAYTLFIMSIVYRFYSWFMLIFVAGIIVLGRDFGPMYFAEKRARETGVLAVGDADKADLVPEDLKPDPKKPMRVFNAAVPFSLFILLFFPLLFYSGAKQASWGGVGWNVGSRTIIGNADSWQTLYWTCGMILVTQIVMYAVQYSKKWGGCLLEPGQSITAFIAGTGTMYSGMVALIVAFAFAENIKELLIADYLVDALGDSIEVQTLPAITFCLCAVYAFATGTSWGTMAVFFQPALALAVYIYRDKGDKPDKDLDTQRFTDIIVRTIAAILGGATWGDHCSFVSDTTILSATSSGCPLWSHYLTQMPYALISGAMSILFGFLPGGAGAPPVLCIFIGVIVQPLLILCMSSIPGVGGTVPVYGPGVGLVDGGVTANFLTLSKASDVDTEDAVAVKLEVVEKQPVDDDDEVAFVDDNAKEGEGP
ncbi:hypothetical protein CTAYLR_000880 [Chrysophaeum taylorii]|uniref:Na+/H+ antiporter NhaC-like C-terminal domain-containing protein n=1 Tax=Chrysophaeum taylorii TaxID=2483200 RepID=A0AAD7XMI8_9STRA|nr:hypothetical protein CTAYLR_000880 [Chrysophaeum taylorii]